MINGENETKGELKGFQVCYSLNKKDYTKLS